MKPGIHQGVPMADYLALDAVSSGVIRTILDRCPAAAWFESPLNPNRERDDTPATDIGQLAHAALLEGSTDRLAIIDPKDYPAKNGNIPEGWKNDAIRAARDAARAEGKIPVFPATAKAITRMVVAAASKIESVRATEPAVWQAFQPDGGTSETTIVWQEGETLCKARADRISLDCSLIIDYKTAGMSVEPSKWSRTSLYGMGYDISAAWYRRGIRALGGPLPEYVFLAGEVEPPHLHAFIGMEPAALVLAAEKVSAGLKLWQQCVARNEWPGYPARVAYVEPPAYMQAQWEERQVSGDWRVLFPELAEKVEA